MRKRATSPDIMPALLALSGGFMLISAIMRERRRISFRGASVVITGGSRGLGLEISRVLAAEGARLTLIDRDRNELEKARRELIALGGYVAIQECDMRDAHAAGRLIDLVINQRGRIDVLINNAGVVSTGPFENSADEDFRDELDAHVWSALSLVRAALPVMKMQGGGRIVNISSIAGVVAIPRLIPYSTAKFALIGLSDGLRAELARHCIHVTTVVPGIMRNGQRVNAIYKGRDKEEFGWFASLFEVPFLAVNAERAALRIVNACRYGQPCVTLGIPARLFKIMNAFLPGFTAVVMKLLSRALPVDAGKRRQAERNLFMAREP
jgi:NAD(P)-dependent dehydrogenase (short-subunit alcohol dehydrogenase family)